MAYTAIYSMLWVSTTIVALDVSLIKACMRTHLNHEIARSVKTPVSTWSLSRIPFKPQRGTPEWLLHLLEMCDYLDILDYQDIINLLRLR